MWNTFYACRMDAYIVAGLSWTRLPDLLVPSRRSPCHDALWTVEAAVFHLKKNKHPHLLCRLESSMSNSSEITWSATNCLQSVLIHLPEQYPAPLENQNGLPYICG